MSVCRFTSAGRTRPSRGSPEFLKGVGNLYVGVQTPVHSEVADYTSDIVVMAPTGSKTRGLNTGRFTFDWNNDLRHSFGPVTAYGDLGVGNTILDSLYFVRPFNLSFQVGYGHSFLYDYDSVSFELGFRFGSLRR
jgi:hypothetical protein